ncbi:MAG: zinc-ribbon domain-containing protein [Oscillospiraceae bacterium]|nr:zinc-ribbon domain-containing protein [Oscillospiraceae bacterium]
MENYIGKICPFCKTAITAEDEVMVCPSCATPHHKACWDENKGCTTFGCSEQHYVAQGTNPTDVCKKCGAALGDGQDFCPKCGTPKNAPEKPVCAKCGAEITEGHDFCPKCGHKVGLTVDSGVSSAISQFNENQTKKNKKKIIVPIVAVAIAIGLIGGGIAVVPKLMIDTAGYIEQGDLEKAYSKAKTDEDKQLVADAYMAKGDYGLAYDRAPNDESKKMIKYESIAAERSAFSADNLKDPSSFSLREAYYNDYDDEGETTPHLVLYISGANSYGANVSSYWLYTYDNDDKEWEYYCSVSDLSDEEISDYDDADEMIEKIVNNSGRDYIKEARSSGTKLSKDSINRINDMFTDGTLDKVEAISVTE